MKLTLAVLILAVSAAAQSALPNAPSHVRSQWEKKPANVWLSPFKDPAFYVGVANFSASAIADVHSTKVCERNLTCVEAFKGHDHYSYIAPQIALVAGMAYGCSLMLHGHKYWRWACVAVPLGLSIQHWKDYRNIYPNGGVARP